MALANLFLKTEELIIATGVGPNFNARAAPNLAEVRAFPQVFRGGIWMDRIDRIASRFGAKPKSSQPDWRRGFLPSNRMKPRPSFVVK